MVPNEITRNPDETSKQSTSSADPLRTIEEEHARQLDTLKTLEEIIKAQDNTKMTRFASDLLDFFQHDMARHMKHEETGLFPLLKKKCKPSDGLDMILEQLSFEHSLDRDLVEFLVADLKKIAHGHHIAIPERFYINAHAFIETQRRHIQWENRIVLPLSRNRLDDSDLEALKHMMQVC